MQIAMHAKTEELDDHWAGFFDVSLHRPAWRC